MAEVKKVRKCVSMKALLPKKIAEAVERKKSLRRQVHQVEAPVWGWMIKKMAGSCVSAWLPVFLSNMSMYIYMLNLLKTSLEIIRKFMLN